MKPKSKTLHVGGPNVGDRAMFNRLVDEMFDRRWFTNNGQLVQELEAKLAAYLEVKHCIAVCNATVGLQIACHALDLTGEVILPAFTFVATAHALRWVGLTPVFADIDPATHCLDPESVEQRVTERTSAIVGVHVWGQPCDTQALEAVAQRHGLEVVYDAAHAFGCRHLGQPLGNFGRCEVFSFHATKFFNTFEGGAITTNDDALAKKLRLMKNFGFAGVDHVTDLGTNGKMPEICAAMGLANLASIDDFLEVNRANHAAYREGLAGVAGIRVLDFSDVDKSNWQYVVIEVEERFFGRSRDALFEELNSQSIRARRYFFPGCHRMGPYVTECPEQIKRLPCTDQVSSRTLCLPTGTAASLEDVRLVCDLIRRYRV